MEPDFNKYICDGCGVPFILSPFSLVSTLMKTKFCTVNCFDKYIICPQSKAECEFRKKECDTYCWIKN